MFSGQPISRIDTIEDNGKHLNAYSSAAGEYLARYQRANIILFGKMQDVKLNLAFLWPAQLARQTTTTQTGRKPGVGDATIMSQETDDDYKKKCYKKDILQ